MSKHTLKHERRKFNMNYSEEVLYKTVDNLSRQVAQLSVDKALLAAQCDELLAKLQQYENDSVSNNKA